MELSDDQARARFAASQVAVLGTSDETGAAHLVPVTFLVSGDAVYIAIDDKPKRSRGLKRLRNIAADPRVCLLAQHYDEDWNRLWWARADGTARVVEAGSVPFGVLGALAERYPWYRSNPPDGPVIEVAVRRWSGWAFAASPPALGI
ncbi:TIGR03668 family PPOX class F420-dependent oxidoreductase [Actinocrinis puniceicyclus]|uniref:TIGR03668 family PPOX class F420-dependent oxidoreductase n=1 Tax=Actinocrinis puniceicyclus TaxID=977794 RepID=A0A8J8BF12_9ACTN|nr:TIGR03668 family PPOX class F420-dependent oxidoreductase [Actinocrinis puniceicyclus]MBS2966160.1 TIGR03668 family PPOX class F420-dependent oxidoreductase [Actinocrinis puniceicyclus]